MRIGLVLLPDAETSAACVAYAETLTSGMSTRVCVGAAKLPHVSLLHVEAELDPATAWEEASAALPSEATLELLALAVLRYDVPYNAPAAAPATMAWLILPCTPELRDLERKAMSLSWVQNAKVTTANGDRFQPHMTLAIVEGMMQCGPLPADLHGRIATGRLALGVIGPNGVYERSLFK